MTVDNRAIAGRSSKSFYDNGRLQSVLDVIKPGDYLLVNFGINDGGESNPERYAPTCGNADNPATGSFEYYMTFYIKGALDKGRNADSHESDALYQESDAAVQSRLP